MPSTNEKSETSTKAQIQIDKRLTRKRSPISFKTDSNKNLEISSRKHSKTNKKSVQKRKKNITEQLISDLNPKYIGFDPTTEGKRRSRSLTMAHSNFQSKNTPQKVHNLIENEGIFTNSYVKMTPSDIKTDNNISLILNEKISPTFESPIEKLIKKNKELSNLRSSFNEEDSTYFENEKITQTAQSLEKNSANSGYVEQESGTLDLLDKKKSKKISLKTTNKIIRKNKFKNIKKDNILKNSAKLVPSENSNDLNKKNSNDSESEIEARAFQNIPSKNLSPQVLLHKSPQIELMHHDQICKSKNSKILKNVELLAELTRADDIKHNHNTNYNTIENEMCEENNISPKLSNKIFNSDNESSTDLNVLTVNKNIHETDELLKEPVHNCESPKKQLKNSENLCVLKDSQPFLEIIPNQSEKQININPKLSQNFIDIFQKDLNSESLPITEALMSRIENNVNDNKKKEVIINLTNNIDKNSSATLNGINKDKETNFKTTPQKFDSFDTSKFFDKIKCIENDIHEIENSELALENNLYENDILGTVSNTDEELDIMNISSDFDNLNNTNSSELETSNSNFQKRKEGIKDNNTPDRTTNEQSIDVTLNREQNNVVNLENLPSEEIFYNKSNELINKGMPGYISSQSNISAVSLTEAQCLKQESISPESDLSIEQNKLLETKPKNFETQTGPFTENFTYTLMRNARGNKSPSSTDSAKGSSIDIETNFQPKFGEIFWARISKYPYWPCIVWPDPDGKTISIGKNGSRQHIRIHVKFFADNGRRSWIRKEDLMAYNGREDFERKKKEIIQDNNNNPKRRPFTIAENKKPIWNQAVIEASLVLNEHIEKRSEKFTKILEETRLCQYFERRKKRLSLKERRSSVVSTCDSEEMLNNSISHGDIIIGKRDRSPTPESPAFEYIGDFQSFKKRKIELSESFNQLKRTNSLSDLNEKSNSILDLFQSDFNGFTEMIMSFIQPQKDDEERLFCCLKEMWEIKLHSEAATKNTLSNNNNDGEQNTKRYSKRITTLLFRKSLPAPNSPLPTIITKEKSDKPKRGKKEGVPIVQFVEDILDLNKNYLFNGLKREPVCKVCLKPTNLHKCSGNCQTWIHISCADIPEAKSLPAKIKDKKSTQNITNNDTNLMMHITGEENLMKETNQINIDNEILIVEQVKLMELVCLECKEKTPPICYVCKEKEKYDNNSETQTNEAVIKCNINNCRKYFHPSCLKYWPQARLTKSKTKIERFICPSHTCQTCVSDDPKGKFLKLQNCAQCVLCPASYHIDSTCIPAGSKIITATELICPRHRQNKQILNTNWCFICSDGGNLVCCESCPTSFHIECLNIDKIPEAGYICEECETGRLPLYGELVWAKFGIHKWWPCITIPPPQIPNNLFRIKHDDFDFCVRFFGTNDHSWINRGRVFLYQEDDWRYSSKVRTNDKDFVKALEEANLISELLKVKKNLQQNHYKKILLVPTPYKKINVNRLVPPVKLQDIDVSEELNPCDCDPNSEKPCDMYSGCLNRLLLIQCHPKICSAGNKCNNQMFEKRLYAAVKIVRTNGKGFGLVSDELISAGTFIIEYVGELIDDNELKRRIVQKQEEKDENYYFLTMQHGIVIDAGPKGNMARFMNHSCEPNCETQKWNVNGNTRIGLFAITDIPLNTELTFNYNLECIGDDKKPCNCGAEKCAGFIGAKYKKNDKKFEFVRTEISKSEKQKSKGGKKNKISLNSTTNVSTSSTPTVTIPKNA